MNVHLIEILIIFNTHHGMSPWYVLVRMDLPFSQNRRIEALLASDHISNAQKSIPHYIQTALFNANIQNIKN